MGSDSFSKPWFPLAVGGAVVFAVWGMSALALRMFTLQDRGLIGDSFGAINALFSGLALAGVVYAILQQNESRDQQAKALELQSRALDLQLNELKIQQETLQTQLQEMRLQTEAARESQVAQLLIAAVPAAIERSKVARAWLEDSATGHERDDALTRLVQTTTAIEDLFAIAARRIATSELQFRGWGITRAFDVPWPQ